MGCGEASIQWQNQRGGAWFGDRSKEHNAWVGSGVQGMSGVEGVGRNVEGGDQGEMECEMVE